MMTEVIAFEKVVLHSRHSNVFYFEKEGMLFKCLGTKRFIERKFVVETQEIIKVLFGLYQYPEPTKRLLVRYNIPLIHNRDKQKFLSNLKTEVD